MAIQGNTVTGLGPYEQMLASLPDVTRKRNDGNGLVSGAQPSSSTPGASVAPPAQQAPDSEMQGGPTLETVTDRQIRYRTVDGMVRSQDRLAMNRWAIDLHYRRVRSNIPFSYLEKIPNQAIWVAKMPRGLTRERSASTPNKADDLCNKVEAALLADPAKPNPQPHTDSEAADQSGDLMTEVLQQICGESGINWLAKHHWATGVALTCASAFLHYDVDETGGGYQPLQKLAHPQAQDPNNPMVAMVPVPGAPPDPMTGQPPMTEAPTSDPILRYVSPDGSQFVETAAEAGRVWLPAVTCDTVRREQVRIFPATADINDATACVLILWMPLADAMKKWPETVGKMTQEQLLGLAAWRPAFGSENIVPFALKNTVADGQTGPGPEQIGTISPLMQRRMFFYRLYIAKSPEYPKGFQLDTSGYDGGTTLGEKTLEYVVQLPKGGEEPRCRDIPVEQVRPVQDYDGGDPMGWPFIASVAGASDTQSILYSSYLDAINVRLHPHVFIRSTAAVDDDDWADRSTPILLNPSDPEPNYEQFSPLPGEFLPMIENIDRKMDSAARLGETGQGLQTETAVSGVAKQITVQTANRNLSPMLQQQNAAMCRGWRIIGQIVQAFYKVPQLIQFSGEGGSQQSQWWTGVDLGGVDEIGIEPGTGTTQTPEGKAQLVAYAQAQQWITPDKAAKVALLGVTRELGLPPDPVQNAIEREVAQWFKGPPEGWMPARPQMDPMGQPVINPQTMQPMMTPPSFSPFVQRPANSEPMVAKTRMERLSEAQMSPEYTAFPPEWRALLDQEYTVMRQALAMASQPAQPQQPPQSGKPGEQPKQPQSPGPVGAGPQPVGKAA